MTISTDAHPLKSLRHRRTTSIAMVVGGPRWNRLLERQRLSSEAMAVARPFNGMVAALEAQIAELRAALDQGGAGATGPRLSDRAHLLGRAVYRQQLAFGDATGGLDTSIAANDRINETREALDSAAEAVEFIEKALAKGQRRPRTIDR